MNDPDDNIEVLAFLAALAHVGTVIVSAGFAASVIGFVVWIVIRLA